MSYPQNPGPPPYPNHNNAAPPPAAPFAVHTIADQQHRLAAATFEHPSAWQAQSYLEWNFQNYASPVRTFARAFDPTKPAVVELFPIEPFCWIEPNMGFAMPGQPAGGGVTTMQPLSGVDAMTRWVIPKYRNGAPGLRFLGAQPIPDLIQRLGTGMPAAAAQGAQYEGVSALIEYQENGWTIEEEFYGLKIAYPAVPSYGAAGTLMQYNWGFESLWSFRAEKGKLDTVRGAGWHLVRSIRISPQWKQVHAQIIQQLQQQFNQHIAAGYEQINAATRLSQQISANNQEWLNHQQQQRDATHHSEQLRRSAEQAGNNGGYTQNDAFGDYLMGQESYNDPYYQYGSQHTGYHDYVWTDSQGNYQYSDDAGFDPNIGANTNWTLMQKKQVGQ